ncbi:MAG: glucose-6-phosphate isomerase [Anaerovoracaceae bacterium]|jgi:glucose-6-phosphate isomerase
MNKGEFISLDLTMAAISEQELKIWDKGLKEGNARLWSGTEDFTGWVTLPLNFDEAEIQRILDTAEVIKDQCEVFVVIGIGGSYLGARAAITAIDERKGKHPEILFAGQNMSGTYHAQLLEKIRGKEVCLCVISKSGTTTEPSMAFAILKEELYKKYGKEEAAKRIYAITDAEKGVLREETDRVGYVSFVVPDNIGGRYSVLTAVGLLPIAVAEIDIKEMLEGAKSTIYPGAFQESFLNQKSATIKLASQYAAARLALQKKGKVIEVYEYFEPRLKYFAEWLKQLFGESEGKEGKGIFPTSLEFSTDLHSMGQFLQEGNQIFFETILDVIHSETDLKVPESAGGLLAGKSMNAVNRAACQGVMAAHKAAEIPIIKINLPRLDARVFGQMVYFFETACALSSYLQGVNPFNQPGVESYKAEMKRILE